MSFVCPRCGVVRPDDMHLDYCDYDGPEADDVDDEDDEDE